jgi:CRP/FNR family cyclic AMP-dependent transcriptional regulator
MSQSMQKALFILGSLNNDDIEWLIQKGRKEIIEPNKILISEGQKVSAMYFVLTGHLSVVIEALNNKELAIITSGEVVGEISFIDERPPLATVKAIERSEVLSIARTQLSVKLQQDMGFASRFYQGISLCLADRMRGTIRRLGYGVDLELLEENEQPGINPVVLKNLDLAHAKFDWLMSAVKRL